MKKGIEPKPESVYPEAIKPLQLNAAAVQTNKHED
jgi:hypothetical protein